MRSVVLKLANFIGETGLYHLLFPGMLPVFMLHRVTNGNDTTPGGLSADRLRGYLEYLAEKKYQVITMDDVLRTLSAGEAFPARSVLFTIDDGFADHHDVAATVFDEFGYPLNFFVITGLLDQQLWPWDDQVTYAFKHTPIHEAEIRLPSGELYSFNSARKTAVQAVREVRESLKAGDQQGIYDWLKTELYQTLGVAFPEEAPAEYQPMSWDDARSLRARGHGVYPHTYSHRILSTLSPHEKRAEIRESLKRVGEELEFSPQVFAYPTGRPSDYDSQDIEELRHAGFQMAFNTVPAYVKQGQDHYHLPRFSLPENTADFLQIVNRFEALKNKLRN